MEQIKRMPRILAVGIFKILPLATAGDLLVGIKVPGMSRETVECGGVLMNEEFASSGYLSALNIALLEGRLFSAADDADASQSAIINSTTAKLYWPNVSPIGQRFSMSVDTLTVVGVISDVVNQFDDNRVA